MKPAAFDALATRIGAVERQASQAHGEAAFTRLCRLVMSQTDDLAGTAVYADDLAARASRPDVLDAAEAAALVAISPADEVAAEMTTVDYLAALATVARRLA